MLVATSRNHAYKEKLEIFIIDWICFYCLLLYFIMLFTVILQGAPECADGFILRRCLMRSRDVSWRRYEAVINIPQRWKAVKRFHSVFVWRNRRQRIISDGWRWKRGTKKTCHGFSRIFFFFFFTTFANSSNCARCIHNNKFSSLIHTCY